MKVLCKDRFEGGEEARHEKYLEEKHDGRGKKNSNFSRQEYV